MNLDEFLYKLHFRHNEVKPDNVEVDWEDAPLAYKLYRGLPVVPLSAEVPLHLDNNDRHAEPSVSSLGHLLWYVYGLAQTSQALGIIEPGEDMLTYQSNRRFVPSGGALYPSELYVYLKLPGLSAGVYHYDAAHHRLVLLREGNVDSYITSALGNHCDVSSCFAVAFVSTMFWKNYFKYRDFAYRLQGLDLGAVAGQLLEVAKRMGFRAGVHFQFLDRAVNHLLGLDEKEESVYAVIPMSTQPNRAWDVSTQRKMWEIADSDAALSEELIGLRLQHFIRSKKVEEHPWLIAMNEASMLESTKFIKPIHHGVRKCDPGEALELPLVETMHVDLAARCRNRFSPERDFVMGKVSLEQLSHVLREATSSFSYRNDVNAGYVDALTGVSLYLSLYHVEGIPDGAYRYDCSTHALRPVRYGDHRSWLQGALSMDNVNLYQVPLCFHIAGCRDHGKEQLGYRGYRVQQMEAGMLMQRLLLAASACELGGHPLLGFDVGMCDELYEMQEVGLTSLIQIPVGPYRYRLALQGSLHG